MAAKNNNLVNNPVDFSVPWKLSDIVLVVEDQKFHAHRGTLAYWSPVFENMFPSEFKEKYSCEIHLPGKKSKRNKGIATYYVSIYGGEACHKEQLLFFV